MKTENEGKTCEKRIRGHQQQTLNAQTIHSSPPAELFVAENLRTFYHVLSVGCMHRNQKPGYPLPERSTARAPGRHRQPRRLAHPRQT